MPDNTNYNVIDSRNLNQNQVQFYQSLAQLGEEYVIAQKQGDTKWFTDHGFGENGETKGSGQFYLKELALLAYEYHGENPADGARDFFHSEMSGAVNGFGSFKASDPGAKFNEAFEVAGRDPMDALRRLSDGSSTYVEGGYQNYDDFQKHQAGYVDPGAAATTTTSTQPDYIQSQLVDMYNQLQKAGYDPASTPTGKNIMNKLAGSGAMSAAGEGAGSSGYSVAATQGAVAGGLGQYAQQEQTAASGLLSQLAGYQGQQQNYGLGVAGMELKYDEFGHLVTMDNWKKEQDMLARQDSLDARDFSEKMAITNAALGAVSPLGAAGAKAIGGGGGGGGTSGGTGGTSGSGSGTNPNSGQPATGETHEDNDPDTEENDGEAGGDD